MPFRFMNFISSIKVKGLRDNPCLMQPLNLYRRHNEKELLDNSSIHLTYNHAQKGRDIIKMSLNIYWKRR